MKIYMYANMIVRARLRIAIARFGYRPVSRPASAEDGHGIDLFAHTLAAGQFFVRTQGAKNATGGSLNTFFE